MTKPTVAFRNFSTTPKNNHTVSVTIYLCIQGGAKATHSDFEVTSASTCIFMCFVIRAKTTDLLYH